MFPAIRRRFFIEVSAAVIVLLGLAAPQLARSQETEPLEQPAASSLLAAMTTRAGTLKLSYPDAADRSVQLMEAPVLRCNDPTREEMDGAVWLWLEGKRPVAAVCLLFYKKGRWNYELVSLTDEAVEATGRPAWKWHPKAQPRTWLALEGTAMRLSFPTSHTLRRKS